MRPKEFSDLLSAVREKRPLVHHLTNYVTVNDCANITLASGGAPVMADAPEEVAEMAAMAGALVLNIGTLNKAQVASMILAGKAANKKKIPVILDPVGAGATKFRTETVHALMDEVDIAILKGNAGEIGVLSGTGGKVRGVDSHGLTGDAVAIARDFSKSSGFIVCISGATDIVTDGKRTLLVDNGHAMMGSISGTGCMAASVIGAFAAVSPDRVKSSAAALAAFGLAGERAAGRAAGPGSFKAALFDELSSLTPAEFARGVKVHTP
ncbi:MAG: hydroxyethylthiazole kinase [Methanomicrobiales archaeon]|nr:hydroxyethylthiazole kinase [Methanomicrobiales archaeon]